VLVPTSNPLLEGFRWEEPWATPPEDPLEGAGWAHHGLVATAEGRIIGVQSGGDRVCVFDRDGTCLESWPSNLVEPHGMSLVDVEGEGRLWIADPGSKMVPDASGGYEPRGEGSGEVVCFSLSGERLVELPPPPGAAEGYAPTGVVVDERGSVWVADGYGQNLVHRFSAEGDWELSLSGEEGAGRFDCPHAVFGDRGGDEATLYVTDRGNARLQIFDLDGRHLRTVEDGLVSPSALGELGGMLVVAELDARLTFLDEEDRLIGHLGEDAQAPAREGWPNAIGGDGAMVRAPDLRPGLFNSPHGLCVDDDGNLYVAEWLIGGRLIRLRRESKQAED
jgi:sugar lactone lactonase YvrE